MTTSFFISVHQYLLDRIWIGQVLKADIYTKVTGRNVERKHSLDWSFWVYNLKMKMYCNYEAKMTTALSTQNYEHKGLNSSYSIWMMQMPELQIMIRLKCIRNYLKSEIMFQFSHNNWQAVSGIQKMLTILGMYVMKIRKPCNRNLVCCCYIHIKIFNETVFHYFYSGNYL